MEFRQSFQPPALKQPITHQDSLLLIGSCFTENMGQYLRKHKFPVLENPFGIVFNPASVVTVLDAIRTKRVYTHGDLFFAHDCWHSWDHHSRFSHPDAEKALESMNAAIEEAHAFLSQRTVLVVTLGSAFVYRLAENNYRVANCHKMPAQTFTKELLAVDEIVSTLRNSINQLRACYPDLRVLLTVSPVRHLREGFVQNNRSKARLLESVHQLSETMERVEYFPAYELVIDDLREYRFFSEDMVHPNYTATRYVWERFSQAAFDSDTRQLMEEINQVNAGVAHKSFHPHTPAHQAFLRNLLEKMDRLIMHYPYLDFTSERAQVMRDVL
jgi:hypothetical protein